MISKKYSNHWVLRDTITAQKLPILQKKLHAFIIIKNNHEVNAFLWQKE
jgi:hypothetical protein